MRLTRKETDLLWPFNVDQPGMNDLASAQESNTECNLVHYKATKTVAPRCC